jgi:hypothetical protein
MADAKFSFQEKGKMYHPAWIAPEVYIDRMKKRKSYHHEFIGNVKEPFRH